MTAAQPYRDAAGRIRPVPLTSRQRVELERAFEAAGIDDAAGQRTCLSAWLGRDVRGLHRVDGTEFDVVLEQLRSIPAKRAADAANRSEVAS